VEERVTLAEGPSQTLRLDQIADVYALGDAAQRAAVTPREGLNRLESILRKPARFGPVGVVAGHTVLTVGIAMVLQPALTNLAAAALLGAIVGTAKVLNQRRALLAVPGIGPETADVIALYAAGHALFVVDAYTRRIFERLGFLRGGETYDEVQRVFARALPADPALFNDYHAQIVTLAKEHCRKRPVCRGCPLDPWCLKRGV
jgi:hypothetical protein